MKSIWTRVRGIDGGLWSNQLTSGGGEGLAAVSPPAPTPVQAKSSGQIIIAEQKGDKKDASEGKPVEQQLLEQNECKVFEIVPPQPIDAIPVETKSDEQTALPVEELPNIAAADVKPETQTIDVNEPAKVEQNGDKVGAAGQQLSEAEQLKKIEELDKFKNLASQDGLKWELKIREDEIDLLKTRVKSLETELQAALSKPGAKNHEMIEKIKQQQEELLSKARGMIFDKTKMVKNQELQIEALTTQVQSLKDINLITKDLLEIRNSEVKAMEDRLQAMDARFKAEKERFSLVLQRAQTSSNINDDLKIEYETQLKIFKELRQKYEQKVAALVAENNKLKLDAARGALCGTSSEPAQ